MLSSLCIFSTMTMRVVEKLRSSFSTVISAALPRVISRLWRGYVRPSGGLCFAAFGSKVKECPPCGHIFIAKMHRFNRSAKLGKPTLSYKNVPPRTAHINISPFGRNISHAQSAYFTAAKRRFHTAALPPYFTAGKAAHCASAYCCATPRRLARLYAFGSSVSSKM